MTPIIFVPGIMGSRLDLPRINNPALPLDWDPDDQIGMTGLLAIDLLCRIQHF
jgi:hypothetical protein